MRPLVHEKLDEWEKSDIITPVEELMDWVSSLAYSMKPNGRLRLYLNPKDLNDAIKRDHHKTLTVEEITHQLAGSTRFTKLDGTSSYLCIVLDYESSLLTTFNTLWGWYRFVCLPFGLACSQDIFQWMMDRSLSTVKESLELLMTLLYMAKMMQNTTDVYTTSCELPMNMDSSSTRRNVM